MEKKREKLHKMMKDVQKLTKKIKEDKKKNEAHQAEPIQFNLIEQIDKVISC